MVVVVLLLVVATNGQVEAIESLRAAKCVREPKRWSGEVSRSIDSKAVVVARVFH